MKQNKKTYWEQSKLERIKSCYKKNSMGDYLFRFLIKMQEKKAKRKEK